MKINSILFVFIFSINTLYSQNNLNFNYGTYYHITTEEEYPHKPLNKCNYNLSLSLLQLKSDYTFTMKKYSFYSDCPTKLAFCDTTWGTFLIKGDTLILMSDKTEIENKYKRGIYPCMCFVNDSSFIVVNNKTIRWEKNYLFTFTNDKLVSSGLIPSR
ncbi:MAG: hypothetical protein LBR28_07860 [Bacteroidales bacterium]|jgi:hypothetical protein|nr:hypothetical protein [Bacteroidales bacterium]